MRLDTNKFALNLVFLFYNHKLHDDVSNTTYVSSTVFVKNVRRFSTSHKNFCLYLHLWTDLLWILYKNNIIRMIFFVKGHWRSHKVTIMFCFYYLFCLNLNAKIIKTQIFSIVTYELLEIFPLFFYYVSSK